MKLIFCRKCRMAFGFISKKSLSCSCGAISGIYIDQDNVIWCEDEENIGIPFAVDNHSFFARWKADKKINSFYDDWYGTGKIQSWLLKGPDSPGWETITKVTLAEYLEKVRPVIVPTDRSRKRTVCG